MSITRGEAIPPPDVVYVVRKGEKNDQLRHSLRSLRNLPHGTVWIVGYKPSWVRGVEYLPTIQRKSKWENSTANLLTACSHEPVSAEFVYMNDDFYVLHPIDRVPIMHRGPVEQVVDEYARRHGTSHGAYVRGMKVTADLLRAWGCENPLSYELHAPLPVVKARMADVLSRGIQSSVKVLHKRTLYGNAWAIGGELVDDLKITGRRDAMPDGLFVSTNRASFDGAVGARIRKLFPAPSRYEV